MKKSKGVNTKTDTVIKSKKGTKERSKMVQDYIKQHHVEISSGDAWALSAIKRQIQDWL